jgi:hypothetical protein
MSREVWFWLIIDGVLMAWCIWQACQLFAASEGSIRFTSNIEAKERDHAADQDGA